MAARQAETEARAALSSSQATLDALRSVDAEVEKASPLVAALAEQVGERVECRLADLIDADEDIESLLEQLLGDDLAALVVADSATAVDVAARPVPRGYGGPCNDSLPFVVAAERS